MSAQQFQNTGFVSETTHFYQLKFGEKNYYESDFILQKQICVVSFGLVSIN